MNKPLKNKFAIVVFMAPTAVLFLVIIVWSILMSAGYSLNDWDGIGEMTFVGLKNYLSLFVNNNDGFPHAVVNALIFAACSVFIQLPFSLFLAIVLGGGVKGSRFFLSTFFIPVIISTTVIGQLWMKIYNPKYGILNILLNSLGLEHLTRNWLGDPATAFGAVVAAALWQYIGYHMLIMYTGVRSIPTDIFEAATIDGASRFQTAFRITIPLIRPVLKTSLIFSVVGSLKNFDLVYVMTKGGPAGASNLPSTLMVETIFHRNRYGYGSAMAMFIIVLCFAFAYVIRKLFPTED